MTFAVIVQARMGSSRLPGKVLEPIGARTALARCLTRCAAIPGVDEIVCAVPYSVSSDPVAEEAKRWGARVVRGPEGDVLARYAMAARAARADLVMRVTSDCPLIDPALCGRVRGLLAESGADYACNNMPPQFPQGLDCDVFAAERLYDADWLAREPYEREHVTPWLRRDPHLTRAALVGPGTGLERLRWTLDYPQDLAFFRAVFAEMGEAAASASWAEIAALLLRRPDLIAINSDFVDEPRLTQTQRAEVETRYRLAA